MRKRALSISAASLLLALAARLAPAGEAQGRAVGQLDREYEETVRRLCERRTSLGAGENAAEHYEKAFAALSKTENEALDDFLNLTLPRAAPEAMDEMPGAKEEVRKHRDAVSVHLRRGASLKHCAFELDWRAGTAMLMPHLAQARNLAHRAACYGKLLELEGRKAEAARVYLDIIRMGVHLDQDPGPISVLVGIACAGIAAPAVEGLLARGVDAETARLLLDGLRGLPSPPFDASRAIDTERVWFGGCSRREFLKMADGGREGLLKGLDAMDRLDDLMKPLGPITGPHKPWRVPEKPEEIRRLLDEAFEVYDAQMRKLGAATKGPYHESIAGVKRLTKMQESYWKGETREGHFAGTLFGSLAPDVSAFYTRAARCEAQLRGLSLLAAACLGKAEKGEHPRWIETLAAYFPAGVPKDPFTGGDFTYGFADGLPAAECEGDDPEQKKKHPETYHFSLSYRLTLEEWEFKNWRAERERAREKREAPVAEEGGIW